MMVRPSQVAYISAKLPARSETFVYRELFALRRAGYSVKAISVRKPEQNLGAAELESLADSAQIVYKPRIFLNGIVGFFQYPNVAAMVMRDVVLGQGLSLRNRIAVFTQGLAGLGLARDLMSDGIDHIHAHMANTPASIAMYTAAALACPFSFTGHAADLFRDRVLLIEKLKRSSFIACISHWHRRFYQDLCLLDDQRLPIIRCAIDTQEFCPAAQPDNEAASKKANIIRLLTVGRLVPKKGFNFLIDALALYKDRLIGDQEHSMPTLSVNIVGDGPERERLEAKVAERGLTEDIAFLGAQPNHVVRGLMRTSDLFVLPCVQARDGDRDGIPVVLMEAMSSMVCVISGNIPSIRELIKDRVHGRLVDASDPAELADAITELAGNFDKCRQMACAGRARVEEEFSLGLNISRLIKALEASQQITTIASIHTQ